MAYPSKEIAAAQALLSGSLDEAVEAARSAIAVFVRRRGLPEGSLADGEPLIARHEGLEMVLEPQSGLPLMLALVALPCAVTERPALARYLLRTNLNWARTGGGTLAALGPDDEVTLCRMIHLVADGAEALEREVAMTFQIAHGMRAMIDGFDEDGPPPAEADWVMA